MAEQVVIGRVYNLGPNWFCVTPMRIHHGPYRTEGLAIAMLSSIDEQVRLHKKLRRHQRKHGRRGRHG